MQIWNGKNSAPKLLKNWLWGSLGLHLGGVWGVLGPLLGALGGSLGALGALLGLSWDALGTLLGLLGASWAPLGRLLDATWKKGNLSIFLKVQLGSQNPAKLAPKFFKNRCQKTI